MTQSKQDLAAQWCADRFNEAMAKAGRPQSFEPRHITKSVAPAIYGVLMNFVIQVSDACEQAKGILSSGYALGDNPAGEAVKILGRFILREPNPPVDPLVEVLKEINVGTQHAPMKMAEPSAEWLAVKIRAYLDERGLAIELKESSQ